MPLNPKPQRPESCVPGSFLQSQAFDFVLRKGIPGEAGASLMVGVLGSEGIHSTSVLTILKGASRVEGAIGFAVFEFRFEGPDFGG